MNFVQPVANVTVTLPSDQTFMMISKNAFKDLSEKRRFEYDNTIYVLKGDTTESPVTPGGKPLDVLHVVALNETTQFWILNSPDFPFICKIAGNPLGIDADFDRVSSLSSAK